MISWATRGRSQQKIKTRCDSSTLDENCEPKKPLLYNPLSVWCCAVYKEKKRLAHSSFRQCLTPWLQQCDQDPISSHLFLSSAWFCGWLEPQVVALPPHPPITSILPGIFWSLKRMHSQQGRKGQELSVFGRAQVTCQV